MNAVVKTLNPSQAVAEVTPAQMLQIAVSQGADLDKLQKLMELQERWEANQARKAYVVAMTAFKANPPEIVKSKHVSYVNSKGGCTEYDHATLASVCRAIIAGLSEHGLAHRWTTEQAGGRIKVTCIITHALGHSEQTYMESNSDTSGGKNDIQGIGSAVTYLQRYTLLSLTGLATTDMEDTDGRAPAQPVQTITAEQVATLEAMLTKIDPKAKRRYLKAQKLDSLDQILSANYDATFKIIDARRRGAA